MHLTTYGDYCKQKSSPTEYKFLFKKNLSLQSFPVILQPIRCIEIKTVKFRASPYQTLFQLQFALIQECPAVVHLELPMADWRSWELLDFDTHHYHDFLICTKYSEPTSRQTCNVRDFAQLYDVIHSINECQCDELCSSFGDCCFDYDLSFSMSKVQDLSADQGLLTLGNFVQCVPLQLPLTSGDLNQGLGFFLVSACPAGHHFQQECANVNTVPFPSYVHFIPVEIHGIVYRNVFCARCHNAPLKDGIMWGIEIVNPPDLNACMEIIERMDMATMYMAIDQIELYCGFDGYAGPIIHGFLQGPSRLGKVCVVSDPELYPHKKPQQSIADRTFYPDIRPSLPETIFDKHSFDSRHLEKKRVLEPLPHKLSPSQLVEKEFDRCTHALQHVSMKWPRAPDSNTGTGWDKIYFVKTKNGFKATNDVSSICTYCDSTLLLSVTTSTGLISRYLRVGESLLTSGQFLVFFDGSSSLNCSYFGDCNSEISGQKDSLIPFQAHVAISQTGSAISIFSLLCLAFIMITGKKTAKHASKRLHLSLILAKILFFASFTFELFLEKDCLPGHGHLAPCLSSLVFLLFCRLGSEDLHYDVETEE